MLALSATRASQVSIKMEIGDEAPRTKMAATHQADAKLLLVNVVIPVLSSHRLGTVMAGRDVS